MDYREQLEQWATTCSNLAARIIKTSHVLGAGTTDQVGLEASRNLISIAQELWALCDELEATARESYAAEAYRR